MLQPQPLDWGHSYLPPKTFSSFLHRLHPLAEKNLSLIRKGPPTSFLLCYLLQPRGTRVVHTLLSGYLSPLTPQPPTTPESSVTSMGWTLPGLGHPHGLLCSIGASKPAGPVLLCLCLMGMSSLASLSLSWSQGQGPLLPLPYIQSSLTPSPPYFHLSSPPLHPSCPCPCPATHLSLLDKPLCLQASPLIHLLSAERVSRNRSDPITFHDSLLPSRDSADELLFFFPGPELPPMQGIHLTTHETPSPGLCSARHTLPTSLPSCTLPHAPSPTDSPVHPSPSLTLLLWPLQSCGNGKSRGNCSCPSPSCSLCWAPCCSTWPCRSWTRAM